MQKLMKKQWKGLTWAMGSRRSSRRASAPPGSDPGAARSWLRSHPRPQKPSLSLAKSLPHTVSLVSRASKVAVSWLQKMPRWPNCCSSTSKATS